MDREAQGRSTVFPKATGEPNWRNRLAEQISQNGPLFFSVAYKILRDAPAAEDICQQAIVRALPREGELRESSALRAWLVQIIVNDSLRLVQRRKLETDARAPMASQLQSASKPVGLDAEMRESVLIALDLLPERTRTIVALRVMEGMKGREVSKLLGCSDKEVSVHMHRGMEILRHALADWKPS